MQTIFLIHGYNGIPQIFHWLKDQLTAKDYTVIVPEFPTQTTISYDSWSKILDNYSTELATTPVVVAHSVGNAFIIEYCVRHNIPLSTYISLAGFGEAFYNEGRDDLNQVIARMEPTPNELSKFQTLAQHRYSIYSDDDHIVPYQALENFPKLINSEPILIPHIGHMGKKSGLTELPQVLPLINGWDGTIQG